MGRSEHAWKIDEISRDLDLVVFRLEQAPRPDDEGGLRRDRSEVRRALERLRDQLQDLRDQMG